VIALLHGFTGSVASFDALRALLGSAGGGRALALPILGHGADAPGVDTFDGEVDRLASEIAAHVPTPSTPVTLLGYSLGGRLAYGIACRHPHLVARVVAIGAHPGLDGEGERDERARADDAWADMLEREGIDAFTSAWAALPLFATQARAPGARQRAQEAIRRSHDPRGLARALRVLGLGRMPSFRSALAGLERPLDLVVGGEDPKHRALAETLVRELPAARLTVVPATGHNVLLERPEALVPVLS
jgi:2-succinyl-6-hydroxy-2,4-cyclohexadiene-1-carboxylate synthase